MSGNELQFCRRLRDYLRDVNFVNNITVEFLICLLIESSMLEDRLSLVNGAKFTKHGTSDGMEKDKDNCCEYNFSPDFPPVRRLRRWKRLKRI